MRIYLALKDVQRVTARFERMPKAVQAALLKKGERLRSMIRQYIISKKLSGQVLNKKSGKLQRNQRVKMEATQNKIILTAYNVSRYGSIHEKGGYIPAHIIEPKKALALHWTKGRGKKTSDVFARKVDMPTVRMPKRPYMAPSMKELSTTISMELKKSIVEALKSK